jgi:hypothetical protein
MSRFARAIEILEAINMFYQQGNGMATPLYPGALILEGDVTIADAIADCVGPEECGPIVVPYVPRSKRRRYGFNEITGWSGWIGKRKVKRFLSGEEAERWANQQD